jgi:hypothetical protein
LSLWSCGPLAPPWPGGWKLKLKQSEIERAVRAAKAQGLNVSRIDVEASTGKFSIVAAPEGAAGDANPWDEVRVK